jgi:Ca2+-binding RTX toxin-like protein
MRHAPAISTTPRRSPALEPLERRDLLSASLCLPPATAALSRAVHAAADELTYSAGVSAGGTLWICGTDAADDVIFSRDADDHTRYVVNVNGQLAFFGVDRVRRVHVETAGGDDTVIFDETYRQTIVPKAIYGGDGNDRLTGGLLNDLIDGEAGNDTISGRAGDDTITAGDGNDFVSAGFGDDQADGNAGDDWLDGDGGADTLHGDAGNDVVRGNALNDSVYGDAGNDSVTGCEGDDLAEGNDGNDVVEGLTGSDTVRGGAGDDILSGNLLNAGPDLEGDHDLLTGGPGNDDFDPHDDPLLEIADRVLEDAARNPTVATFPTVRQIMAERSFV